MADHAWSGSHRPARFGTVVRGCSASRFSGSGPTFPRQDHRDRRAFDVLRRRESCGDGGPACGAAEWLGLTTNAGDDALTPVP